MHYWEVSDSRNSLMVLNNSLQFFSATSRIITHVNVGIFDESGDLICKRKARLDGHSSIVIDLESELKKLNRSTGSRMISAQIKPWLLSSFPAHLGSLKTQPYMIYLDQDMSIGCVHCLSNLRDPVENYAFTSSQLIDVKDVVELRLHQINPSPESRHVEFSLVCVDDGVKLCTKSKNVPGFGAVTYTFGLSEMRGVPFCAVRSDSGLPSCNAKPIIERVLTDGTSWFSHS